MPNQSRLSALVNTNSQIKAKKLQDQSSSLSTVIQHSKISYKIQPNSQDAEEHLKQLSIRYDLSQDEQNTIKELVEEAKEK